MAGELDSRRKQTADKLFFNIADVNTEPAQTSASIGQEITLQTKLGMLEKLYKKELFKWWEAESLSRYIEVKRVPRGLRIFTIPTYEDPDPDMINEWSDNTSSCSMIMMKILVKYALKDRAKLLKDIEDLLAEIEPLMAKEALEEHLKKLNVKMEKLEEEITAKKQRKFIKDFKDYHSGRTLTFQKKYDHLFDKKTGMALAGQPKSGPSAEAVESDVSDGNLSDASTSGITQEPSMNVNKKVNFLTQFQMMSQNRTDTFQGEGGKQRGRGRGSRGGTGGTNKQKRGGSNATQAPMGMATRSKNSKLISLW
ncbi:uncharacterized protein LOC144767537 [Lissotriton helveticus]